MKISIFETSISRWIIVSFLFRKTLNFIHAIQWKYTEYTENFEKERVKDTIDLYCDLQVNKVYVNEEERKQRVWERRTEWKQRDRWWIGEGEESVDPRSETSAVTNRDRRAIVPLVVDGRQRVDEPTNRARPL